MDLKNYRAPRDAFQLIEEEVAGLIVGICAFVILLIFVLPEIVAKFRAVVGA